MFIYQYKNWPHFAWNESKLFKILTKIVQHQGKLIGRMESLGFTLRSETTLNTMTLEAIKSNEIEGEILSPEEVRSSIARKLGMDIGGMISTDRNVEGVAEVILDATQNYKSLLTEDRLFGWHAALFPSGRTGLRKIITGAWRNNTHDDPMQVVSGAMGKERIHFQAPPAKSLQIEMKNFLDWFNINNDMHPIIKAAIAHLWFVTIHPFDDGNGRIARTIADMQLARADEIPRRFYSMSAQIRLERKHYYDILEETQRGSLDITAWLEWFLACLDRALFAAEEKLSGVLNKAHYWDLWNKKNFNERQKLMLNKLLDGFDGKLTTSKWAKITKSSQDSALRDIQDLLEKGVLEKEEGGGRSSGYRLKSEE